MPNSRCACIEQAATVKAWQQQQQQQQQPTAGNPACCHELRLSCRSAAHVYLSGQGS